MRRRSLATLFLACAAAAAPLGAQPAQQLAPGVGTELQMKPYTVQGQNQLRGRFGGAWSENEVRARAAQTCAGAGWQLVYFKAEAADSKGRRTFAAVCK